MKGLLYKDWCLVRHSLLIGIAMMLYASCFGIISLLGLTVGNFQFDFADEFFVAGVAKFVICFIAAVGIYFTVNCVKVMDYDEKSEWYKVLYASPVPFWKEVMSRYVLLIIANTLVSLTVSAVCPLIYLAGGCEFGTEQMKYAAYAWLAGILMIFIRLPIEIILPAKVSTAVNIGFMTALMVGLMVWISLVGHVDIVVETIAGWMKVVCRYGIIIMVLLAVLSYGAAYFGKRNRRWL